MNYGYLFYLNAAAFGVALAMDAFSVSLANGLAEPRMKTGKMCLIAGVFAGFQILMPLIGWLCVHTIAELFSSFRRFIPWIALGLLGYIGGDMLLEGIKARKGGGEDTAAVGLGSLLVQGVATSIDALSVGFTIAELSGAEALVESAIIALVTFAICVAGLLLGKKAGEKLCGKASVLGGIILILIGAEIFVTGVIL